MIQNGKADDNSVKYGIMMLRVPHTPYSLCVTERAIIKAKAIPVATVSNLAVKSMKPEYWVLISFLVKQSPISSLW